MKVLIPSKGRAATLSSHRLDAFQHQEIKVLVHNDTEAQEYTAHNPDADIIVTNTLADTYGLTRQREWACANLVEPDEWFVFCDDNVRELTAVAMPEYDKPTLATTERGNWKALYSHDVPASRFIDIADDTIIMCKELGAHVAGFATNSNPFFRSKKFRSIGYVVGKLMLWHNVPFTWDHTVSMEDFRNTAEQTLLHGAVCINNYVFPVAGHYEAGGMGPYDARVAHRLDDVQRLLLRYPGFFRVRNRKGFVRNTDLAVRMTNAKQVAYWRAGMRA